MTSLAAQDEWIETGVKDTAGMTAIWGRSGTTLSGLSGTTIHDRLATFADRLAARRATRIKLTPHFVAHPDPRGLGSQARGRHLLSGQFRFEGSLIKVEPDKLWSTPPPTPAFCDDLQSFSWLDDLAALGTPAARTRAQDWVFGWIDAFGAGTGPGWRADLTGRRLIRLTDHARLVLNGRLRDIADRFLQSLGQQVIFVARRWDALPPSLARIDAQTGLIQAGLALDGMAEYALPAATALARDCETLIDAQGAIPSRNPEELMEMMRRLLCVCDAMTRANHTPDPAIFHAIARMAPVLRSLRHADGGLARFHGGGRGPEGHLDGALAASGIRTPAFDGPAMGFVRLHAGRSTVIVDAARPPSDATAVHGHASTLGIEMTSGRWPVIVNCGSGEKFGADWHRASRATASHSTIALAGYSSSRLAAVRAWRGPHAALAETPQEVWVHPGDAAAHEATFGHDGYVPTHGLTHLRHLTLSADGATLRGTDTLAPLSTDARAHFDALQTRHPDRLTFDLRFHLHPDVDAALDMGGWAVSLALRSGELWIFRFKGPATLTLAPSVYLERDRTKPRSSRQIVLSGPAQALSTEIVWTFERVQVRPPSIQDNGAATPLPDI